LQKCADFAYGRCMTQVSRQRGTERIDFVQRLSKHDLSGILWMASITFKSTTLVSIYEPLVA